MLDIVCTRDTMATDLEFQEYNDVKDSGTTANLDIIGHSEINKMSSCRESEGVLVIP